MKGIIRSMPGLHKVLSGLLIIVLVSFTAVGLVFAPQQTNIPFNKMYLQFEINGHSSWIGSGNARITGGISYYFTDVGSSTATHTTSGNLAYSWDNGNYDFDPILPYSRTVNLQTREYSGEDAGTYTYLWAPRGISKDSTFKVWDFQFEITGKLKMTVWVRSLIAG